MGEQHREVVTNTKASHEVHHSKRPTFSNSKSASDDQNVVRNELNLLSQ